MTCVVRKIRFQMRSRVLIRLAAAVLAIVAIAPARADVRLPRIFSDNMVLQRGMRIPVWGWAEPGEKVTVLLGEATKSAKTDRAGRWRVGLPARAEATDLTLTVRGANEIKLTGVAIGEVWICSGQSNMQFALEKALNGQHEAAKANHPGIRLFTVNPVVAAEPRDDVEGSWSVCTAQSAAPFSAVAYFFGRAIHKHLGVPIGLINISQGWTPAEAWMSREAILADPETRYIAERWDAITAVWPQEQAEHAERMAAWKTKSEAAKAAGKPEPPQPRAPIHPMFFHRASGFYNSGIAPLAPIAMRGVIWYQGETNEVRGYQYRRLFPALIRDWRRAWEGRIFPFIYVQVASVLPPDTQPKLSEWAELRESQTLALAEPATAMAVAIDIGEANDVHPKNKQEVGRRLALAARAKAYGEKGLVYSGPMYERMAIEGGSIRIYFTHVGSGLKVRGEKLRHWAIAGEDQKFVWAEAVIDGDTVVVRSDAVPKPVAVRYAWSNNAEGCNLYNREDLPAVPFRTDTWIEKTRGYTKLTLD